MKAKRIDRKYCKKCKSLLSVRRWRKKHIEKDRSQARAWARSHVEINRARVKVWYKNNKEKAKETIKLWKERNPKKSSEYTNRRRALKRNTQVNKISHLKIFLKTPYCFYCNKKITLKESELDHYIPLSKGGKHIESNLKVSCHLCNYKKLAKMPDDFYKTDYFKNLKGDKK
jgi:5-methylcytosine-specific restriction endonuclease McrA